MFREYLLKTYNITDRQLAKVESGILKGYTLKRMMFIYFRNDMKYNQDLKIDLEVYIEDCLL
jgi:hypothetical protein